MYFGTAWYMPECGAIMLFSPLHEFKRVGEHEVCVRKASEG